MARRNAQERETASGNPGGSVDELSFEQAMEELEAIIERIEQGQIGLEESLAQRKRGDGLIKRCRAVLDQAEQELMQVKPE
jgi:exodeoxyribonuclease VII small subunit